MINQKETPLVNRIIDNSPDLSLRTVEITEDVLLQLECIAHGVFTPLTGFPSLKDIDSIINTWKLSDGSFFPIPPLCHLLEKDYNEVNVGEYLLLTFNSKPVGTIKIDEKGILNKKDFIEKIFKTYDPSHPGVLYVSNMSSFIITGKIWKFKKDYFFGEDTLPPLKVKEEFKKRNWDTITAFSTTNVPHRAHEQLQRTALEITDGLFIHTLRQLHRKKYSKDQIKNSYYALINNYYNSDNVFFSFLPMISMSAGPREVGLQSVIRYNYGVTHFIVGRDHSGFKNTYGIYDSQRIFSKFPEIKVKPLLLKGPFYCKNCDLITTENSCKHSEDFHEEISGTRIRKLIAEHRAVPEYLMRKEVLKELIKYQENNDELKL
jgi:sulfate adenylyltransferase